VSTSSASWTSDRCLFALPRDLAAAARVRVLPVGFDATASYGKGTAKAPERVLRASQQVDLFDPVFGDAWRAGIALEPADGRLAGWNRDASGAAARAVALWERGAPVADRLDDIGIVDRVTSALAKHLREGVGALLDGGHIPGVLGGDHSVALGGLQAALDRTPGLGVLQIDAHADLRPSYQGFRHSHASILHNVLAHDPAPTCVVQVGLRDLSAEEWAFATAHPALHPNLARDLEGVAWIDRALAPLPQDLWITFDIDGLDPTLCPATGTPVPGGLDWRQAMTLLEVVARRGHRVVGFDLTEVGNAEWDANVGARLLLKLATLALITQPSESGP